MMVELSGQLHSLPVRPDFSWIPSTQLSEMLALDQNLFIHGLLGKTDHSQLIEQYPPMRNLSYVPPQTVPSAHEQMSAHHRSTDSMLKHHQYVLFAVFRPLDVLASEISKDGENPHIDRYLVMIQHTRQLLLHTNNAITQSRKNIAFKAVNTTFKAPGEVTDEGFIMAPEEFQASVAKQHTMSQSVKDANRSIVSARWFQQQRQRFQPQASQQQQSEAPQQQPQLQQPKQTPPQQHFLQLSEDNLPVGGRLSAHAKQ
ncbi:hypothetical protein BD560DRAFT_429069 [Blakeslea trispora]|nr:hypothetical protein BD560DRAFT_429069 [Blakeslea trispora]